MKRVRVGDVLHLERRAIDVDRLANYEEIGVRSFGRGIFHKEPVDGLSLGNKRMFEVRPGDLIFSNVFAWEGAVALAGEKEVGKCGSHRFMTYVAKTPDVDLAFYAYYFRSEHGLDSLGRASPGSAGRNRTLAIDRFEDLEVPWLAHADQRSVVSRLEAALGNVEAGCRALNRGAVLASALVVSVAHRLDISKVEKRAQGWHRVALREIMVPVQEQVAVVPGGSYPNVGILSFGRGLFRKPPIDGSLTSATKLYRIRTNQFVYSRLFAFEGAYAVVDERFDGFFVSNEFPTFDVDASRGHPLFLAAYFGAPHVWHELARQSKGLGVRRQRVPTDAVLDHEIWLPPISEQQRVAAAVVLSERSSAVRSQMRVRLDALGKSALNREFAQLS